MAVAAGVARGFKRSLQVLLHEIAPCPGGLKRIEASMPTPHGVVSVDFRFDGPAVEGSVVVPEGLAGEFRWNGTVRALRSGVNPLSP